MTKIKDDSDKWNWLSWSEWKFLKEIESYFGLPWEEIKIIIEMFKAVWSDMNKLELTEQFNIWFMEWCKSVSNSLGQHLAKNVKQPIQDFNEISPTSTVEDIVITDRITDDTWSL